jgi:7,8-dihydro-6-hydroxymethylpterin-pyrophosphokinase
MARVYLSLGSNQNRDHYIRQGLDALIQTFPPCMKAKPWALVGMLFII